MSEHVAKLKEWEEGNYVPDPNSYEFELITAIAEEIERAYKGKSTIKLTYWHNGELKDDYGVPIEINVKNKLIVIDDPFGTTRYLFNEIVAVSIVN